MLRRRKIRLRVICRGVIRGKTSFTKSGIFGSSRLDEVPSVNNRKCLLCLRLKSLNKEVKRVIYNDSNTQIKLQIPRRKRLRILFEYSQRLFIRNNFLRSTTHVGIKRGVGCPVSTLTSR